MRQTRACALNQPTLSVILCNYNHAHYIGEQLQALLNQTFRPLEIIVIDDGSTDNSIEVIESFAQKDSIVHLFCNDRNRGVVFSANRALELTSGEYIYWASADDQVQPGLFEKSMCLLAQYPEAGLCCSDPMSFDSDTGLVNDNSLDISADPCYFSAEQIVKQVGYRIVRLSGHTSIIKRSALLEAGEFIPELKWYCDWFAALVISFRYGICYVPEGLAMMRRVSNSYSSGRKKWLAECEVLDHLINILKLSDYHDILPSFQRSRLLSYFGFKILYVALRNSEHWSFLTILPGRKILWDEIKRSVGRVAPAELKQIYRKVNFRDQRISGVQKSNQFDVKNYG